MNSRSSFIVHRSSFIVHRSSFIVHRSSFIVHRSIASQSPVPQEIASAKIHATSGFARLTTRGARDMFATQR